MNSFTEGLPCQKCQVDMLEMLPKAEFEYHNTVHHLEMFIYHCFIVLHRTQYKFIFTSHSSKTVQKHSLKSVQYGTGPHVKI